MSKDHPHWFSGWIERTVISLQVQFVFLDFRCLGSSLKSVRIWFYGTFSWVSCTLGTLSGLYSLSCKTEQTALSCFFKKLTYSANVDLGEPKGIQALLVSFCWLVIGNNSLLRVLVTDLVSCEIPYVDPHARQHGVAMCQQIRPEKEGLYVGQHVWEWWRKGWDVSWVLLPAACFEHQAVLVDESTLGARKPPSLAHGIILWLFAMLRASQIRPTSCILHLTMWRK